MAYTFNGSSQYLLIGSAPVTTTPLTMACWVRPANTTVGVYLSLGVSAGTARYQLYQGQSSANNVAAGVVNTAGTSANANGSTVTANVWHHTAGVFTSATSRTIYKNGVSVGSNTTSITVATPNSLLVGARYASTLGTYFNGRIADVGLWNISLTASDLLALADGISCEHVRPENLVFYAPLDRNLLDVIGGTTITNGGSATVSDNNRIYR